MITAGLIESYARQPRAERLLVDADVVFGARRMGEGPFTVDDVRAKRDAIQVKDNGFVWGDPLATAPKLTQEQKDARAELAELARFLDTPAYIEALEAFAHAHSGATRVLGG